MMREFLKGRIAKNREMILRESLQFNDFMGLLMKRRNTGLPRTKEETVRLRRCLVRLSLYVPILAVFLLPFGSLLLPLLAEALDRRELSRASRATRPAGRGQAG